MNHTYPFKHWIATLLMAPLFPLVYEKLFGPIIGSVMGWLELYPFAFIFSLFISIPTLIFYCVIFYFISKKNWNIFFVKGVLVSCTIIGVIVTFLIVGGKIAEPLALSYILAAIISGYLIKLNKPNIIFNNIF